MNTKKDSGSKSPAKTSRDAKAFPATSAIEEGPYYKSGSPPRTDIRAAGIPGEKLTLSGYVRDTRGNPLSNAWLDFWQADGKGNYDNEGYVLRGRQYTDKSGKYSLKTVVPGAYPGRTPHIHAKARAGENSPLLTTQLFIPGIPGNEADFLYKPDLLIKMEDGPGEKTATFDFYLETSPGVE